MTNKLKKIRYVLSCITELDTIKHNLDSNTYIIHFTKHYYITHLRTVEHTIELPQEYIDRWDYMIICKDILLNLPVEFIKDWLSFIFIRRDNNNG